MYTKTALWLIFSSALFIGFTAKAEEKQPSWSVQLDEGTEILNIRENHNLLEVTTQNSKLFFDLLNGQQINEYPIDSKHPLKKKEEVTFQSSVEGAKLIESANAVLGYGKSKKVPIFWHTKIVNAKHLANLKKDMLLAATTDGFLYALDPKDGEFIWGYDSKTRRAILSVNQLASEDVLLTTSLNSNADKRYLHAIGIETGRAFWKKRISPSATYIVKKDRVYIHDQDEVLALDLVSGKRYWSAKLLAKQGTSSVSPLLKNGVLVVAGTSYLYAFEVR